MRSILVVLVAAVACRPPPPKGSWLDEDLGQTHARRAPPPASAPVPEPVPEPVPVPVPDPDEPAVDRARIAVLLPLSGRFAPLGRELRTAIELAPVEGAERMFLDTRGEPAGAADAVAQAAAAGAVAVLGPVGVREAEAAAARARELHLPIALLAPGGVTDGALVFRLVESAQSEARAAATVAAALGTPTAGVLTPNDDVGLATAQAFADAATAAGIEVTARGTYDPTAADLQADVKVFLGLDPTTNPRLAAHLRRHGTRGWTTFSPDVPFATLYLPDRHDRAAIVAAFFPYLGVELRTADFLDPDYLRRKHGGRIPQVVQLLGSSGWNHPTLATRGGPAVEGAYFIEPCPGLLGEPAAVELFTALESRLGRHPSSAAQQAHDAWIIVARARTAAAVAHHDVRGAFARALAGARFDDGACTAAAMAPDGQLVREPALLGVEAGEITVVPY
jgi:branched-chain amino acid transport system substrate-binding protein